MIKIKDIAEDQIMFYDLETGMETAAYTHPRLIGCKYGFHGEVIVVEDFDSRKKFKKALRDPSILKVGFNNKNFDDIVLRRHGFSICEENSHDCYLMMKAICPKLPSYSLKFINWWFLGDPHWPEMALEEWALRNKCDKWSAPDEILKPYHAHDIQQHQNVFRMAWEIVQQPKHWAAYLLDLSQGEIVYEMTTKGGLHIHPQRLDSTVATLQLQVRELKEAGEYFSDGQVTNPNSSKQLGAYLTQEGFALSLSNNGEFAVRKEDLVDLRFENDVAACAYEIRKINGSLSFLKNYQSALQDTTYSEPNWIPTSYSISAAGTRRYISSSYYGINFQNPDEEAKKVQIVPDGYLGWWLDGTQIENIVHIYESEDNIRRREYESDPDWNEYVWLCNFILGSKKQKKELDSIPSPQIPKWSIYKQFKTAKLAINFGMGVSKFCKTTGVSQEIGQSTFEQIHEVCPAIHSLQDKVRKKLEKQGYVQDVFGHCYENTPRMAYKAVAYLIQGCGTGSLPKAQMRANFDTIHSYGSKAGCLCTTTHDENSGRLNLQLGEDKVVAILQQLYYNMTKKFSSKFDNIPLRAKLYIAGPGTSNADRTEVKIEEVTSNLIQKLCK